jgi:arginyl-tRNA synthetase
MLNSFEHKVIHTICEIYPEAKSANIAFEKPKQIEHGDIALNTAMMLAKILKSNPREIAKNIKSHLLQIDEIDHIEIAGPGFINIFLKLSEITKFTHQVAQNSNELFPKNEQTLPRIYLEFVSANPTGPLHVGHGRSAVIGKALERILEKCHYPVTSAYYVNDAGTQIDTLTCSVILRMIPNADFHSTCYQGDYIKDIAMLATALESSVSHNIAQDSTKWASLKPEDGQKQLIADIQKHMSTEAYQSLKSLCIQEILNSIKEDLSELNITYDEWFYESTLLKNNQVNAAISQLEKNNMLYTQDGAKWFKSSELGDTKDRVIIRSNGQHTYFLNDIAYHQYKYSDYDQAINLMGSDHHGYGPRLEAAKNALGYQDKILTMKYMQFAILWKNGEKLPMSTRQGQYTTLKTLYDEVGTGPTLFFYALKKPDQHLDFDMDLAKKQSSDNPYYYVQYAHARISQLLKKAKWQLTGDLSELSQSSERQLMNQLMHFKTALSRAARDLEPHQICFYLMDLSKLLHQYYNDTPILKNTDQNLMNARLTLLKATANTLSEGLSLLGIKAVENM